MVLAPAPQGIDQGAPAVDQDYYHSGARPLDGRTYSAVKNLIMGEVNVKGGGTDRKTTADYQTHQAQSQTLGPRFGQYMKQIAAPTATFRRSVSKRDRGRARNGARPGTAQINNRDARRFRDHWRTCPDGSSHREGKIDRMRRTLLVTEELKA